MSDVIHIAIKYRLYPTAEQKTFFAKSFGCCRKIWNLMLSDKLDYYSQEKKMLHNTPAQYKEQYPYLREVDSLALANVQMQLQQAWKNYFSNSKFGKPKFKAKKHCRKESYTTNCQHHSIALLDKAIKLPKVGTVKAKLHRMPKADWKLKSATVSRTGSGKYFVAVLFEVPAPVLTCPSANPRAIGLDYKSDGFYVSSEGQTIGSPKYYRKAQKQLAKAQRKLSRKKKSSNNYYKQKQKVAKIHEHIANQRFDFTHQQSAAITKQYDIICVETLDMKAMANKGFGNGKATLDNGWGMFLSQLKYKTVREGSQLVFVDKWFPSSQLCHKCGILNPKVKNLAIRKWKCPCCGAIHDRDVNAACNIRDEGLHQLQKQLSA